VSSLYQVSAMPSSVIVDRKGRVRYVHHGYKPGDETSSSRRSARSSRNDGRRRSIVRSNRHELLEAPAPRRDRVAGRRCGHIEPWVKPYERDRLADPIMSWGRDPVSIAYLSHVRDAREGSRGASGTAGGGCGCN